jgi:hypothetical protein
MTTLTAPHASPAPPETGHRLRVGILVDTLRQPLWVMRMLEEVRALPFVDLAVVVLRQAAPEETPARSGRWPSVRGVWKNRKHLLFSLYSKLDGHLYRGDPDPFEPVDLTPLIGGVPVVEVRPRMTRFCDYFEESDCETLRAYDLDVAIRLGFRILKSGALDIARHGVWSYHHGDNHIHRGGPAGFWEVMEGRTHTGSILQVLTDELDDGVVLSRRFGRTDRLSVESNRSHCYWQSVPMVARKLRELHELGPDALRRPTEEAGYRPYSNRLYTKPTNAEMLRPLGRLVGRRLRNHARNLGSFNQWILAYRLHRKCDDEAAPHASFYGFNVLLPPRDRFWADPFPVLHDGKHFLFIEEYPYATRRGHISVMELKSDRSWSEPRPVLVRPYHLSYPFVFRWQGDHFMVPETENNRTIELYRCTSFPDEWELDTILLRDVSAVDATLFEHGGRWWMFTNMAPQGARDWDEELHLYHAASPRGPWTPHPRNPIKSDVRSSRPAGRIFSHRGGLYRPAQNCAERYGHGITLNRIVKLSPSEYEEVEESNILPHWRPDLLGTHTLNAVPGLTVVDGLLRRGRLGRPR